MRERIKKLVRRVSGAEAVAHQVAGLEDELRRHEAGARARGSEADRWRAEVEGRLATLELRASIAPVMASIARASLESEPLISVITPTLGRPDVLSRAIESALAQTHDNWELVVVADDAGRRTAEGFGDERIRTLEQREPGVCAARNLGLAAARGELVAYLDDDNLMDSGWLRTVAWAFERRPEVDVVYGAYVIDDVDRLTRPGGGGLPGLVLNPFVRDRLPVENPADMGAIAHRAALPEARFDERLGRLGDWELLARLVASKDPFVVPAIACYYATDAGRRLSLAPVSEAEIEAVMRACEAAAA